MWCPECRVARNAGKVGKPLVCKVCGREFPLTRPGNPPACCSPECKYAHNAADHRARLERRTEEEKDAARELARARKYHHRVWERAHPGATWEQHLRERAERKATERARITEKAREYWEANRDTINAKKRQDRLDNPGRESRASKEWRKNNKEKGRHAVRRRRARRKGAGGSHTVEDVRAIVAMQTPAGKRNPRCWWCDEEIGGTYHVDHRIPLAKGGGDEPGNLVIACPRCNLSKHTRMPHEFAGRLL